MPLFDEWGLRLAGLEGPCKNPVLVVPLPVEMAAGAAAEEMMQADALEVAASKARVSHPEGAAGELA